MTYNVYDTVKLTENTKFTVGTDINVGDIIMYSCNSDLSFSILKKQAISADGFINFGGITVTRMSAIGGTGTLTIEEDFDYVTFDAGFELSIKRLIISDNSRQITEKMQASFPHTYNVYDKNTILYALLSVIGERYGARTDIIDRLYAMIGIDSTYNQDLEHRWGSLLRIYRQDNESYDSYRSRLLTVYSSLAGGTAEAIKYAIASVIGIINADDIDRYINVYDAWKYPYEIDENIVSDTSYGHIICTVDISANESIILSIYKIMDIINKTKASGIYPYLLFMHTANESATLSYNEETLTNIIDKRYDVNGSIKSTDIPTNRLIDRIQESAFIAPSKEWSYMGTNQMMINVDLVTNMKIENDDYVDRIFVRNSVVSASSIFGEAIFGEAIFG